MRGRGVRAIGVGMVLLLALGAAAIAWPARSAAKAAEAAEPQVHMQVRAGFDGKAKPWGWVPLEVELANRGPDLDGELQMDVRPNYAPPIYQTRYTASVALPAGARKRYRLIAPMVDGGSLPEVRLVAGDKHVYTVQPTVTMAPDVIVGVLGPDASTLGPLAGVRLQGPNQPLRVVPLTADSLPDQARVLRNFDALLIDNFPSSTLTEAQRRAVRAWVADGGLLIIAGGPEARKTIEPWRPWLPLRLAGEATLRGAPSLAALGGRALPAGVLPVSRAELPADARLLASDGGVPLVALTPAGVGAVAYLAFDPSLSPLEGWPGMTAVWRQVFVRGLPMQRTVQMGGPPPGMALQNLTYVAGNLPVDELPSVRSFLWVIGGYILLLGPVNFLILRRLRKVQWAWVTVPALVALFSAGTWYAARAQGGELITHAISIVELQPGADQHPARAVVGVFLPSETARRLRFESDDLVQVIPTGPYFGGPVDAKQAPIGAVVRGGEVELRELALWSMRGIALETVAKLPGVFEGRLVLEKGSARGKLVNRTGAAVQDAVVITAGGFQRIGDLGPGAGADVDFAVSTGGNVGPVGPRGWGPEPFWQAINQLYNPGPWEGRPSKEQRQKIMRQQIANQFFGAGKFPQNLPHPAYLIAWSDVAPFSFQVEGSRPRSFQTTMLVQPLELDIGDGDFELPPGVLRPRLIDWEGRDGVMGGPGFAMPLQGSVTLEYVLPAGARGRVRSLEFRVPLYGRPGPGSDPLLAAEFFDHRGGRWVREEPAGDHLWTLADAARYVAPDGSVRVKVSKTTRDSFPVGVPSLGFAGVGKP